MSLDDLYHKAGECVRERNYAEALSYLEYALSQYPDDAKTQILVEILRLKRMCEEFLAREV
ncbi:MAG: hypothetical protein D6675_16555 [Gemmatimonadetes bacterium]|nr:MAG: hypothetical protein D6675_16555 [Gemmatimonadota bacterium]